MKRFLSLVGIFSVMTGLFQTLPAPASAQTINDVPVVVRNAGQTQAPSATGMLTIINRTGDLVDIYIDGRHTSCIAPYDDETFIADAGHYELQARSDDHSWGPRTLRVNDGEESTWTLTY